MERNIMKQKRKKKIKIRKKEKVQKEIREKERVKKRHTKKTPKNHNIKHHRHVIYLNKIQLQGLGNRGRTEAKRRRDQESPEQVAKRPRLAHQKPQSKHRVHTHTSPQHPTETSEAPKEFHMKNPTPRGN